MFSYIAVVRNWSWKSEGLIAASSDLDTLKDLLDKKLGTDIYEKHNYVQEDDAFLPNVNCIFIFELTKQESELICPIKDNCWVLYILECQEKVVDIHKCFKTIRQAPYWLKQDSEDGSDENN